ncbi:MAG: glycosyltransferase family 39 protein [Chloroflexi bacterium]|nr:glycosyltransferase family 39 protein [Chloroflexota bacterium]
MKSELPGASGRPIGHTRLLAAFILAIYGVLAVMYSIVLPPWEAPDEPEHLSYIRYLATQRKLPDVSLAAFEVGGDEGGQAPLYYALGALVVSGIDVGNLDLLRLNPYRTWKNHPAERAMFEHGQDETFPWQRAVLALHLVRLLSVAFGIGTAACVYSVTRLAFPSEPRLPLLALALLGLNPGFVAATAVANNDAAVALTSAIALLLVARTLVGVRSGANGWAIGMALGLALLSKANAMLVAPFALAPAFSQASGRRSGVAYATKAIVAASVVSGWWYAWNWWKFGTPLRKEPEFMFAAPTRWVIGFSPDHLWRTVRSVFKPTGDSRAGPGHSWTPRPTQFGHGLSSGNRWRRPGLASRGMVATTTGDHLHSSSSCYRRNCVPSSRQG